MNSSPTYKAGRNEPCPCGSGKKFKRCHGMEAPSVSTSPPPSGNSQPLGMPGAMPGFDPSQMDPSKMDPSKIDPQWLLQFSTAMQRLPRGQLQKFQALMQKAMRGKDVSREMEEFQGTLPVELQGLIAQAPIPSGGEGHLQSSPNSDGVTSETETSSKFSKFWKKFKK